MHSHMHTCTNKINALMEELGFDFFLNFSYLSKGHYLSVTADSTSTLLIVVFMKT